MGSGAWIRVGGAKEGSATAEDVSWERRVAEEEVGALASARSAAASWTAAITSLTGVFGVVALVKGPEDVTKLEGNVGSWLPLEATVLRDATVAFVLLGVPAFVFSARVLARTSLFLVRALITTVGLALIALGLLTWSQGWLWETVVIVALGLAVGLAAAAIMGSAAAAYGMPRTSLAGSGWLVRARRRRDLRRALALLRASLFAASGAIVAVAVAIGVTWIKTPDTPRPVLVVGRNGLEACGEIVGQDARSIQIKEEGKPLARELPKKDVQAVDAC